MNAQSMTTLDAALLAYSMDELEAMGPNSRQLLGARVARELATNPQPDASRMLELRRRMELTHFHPALAGLRKSLQASATPPSTTSASQPETAQTPQP